MPPPTDLRISSAGLALIERFEGFEPDWYLDPVGVRTIAFGWTGELPPGYTPPLTRAEGRRLLLDTVGTYEAAVRRHVSVALAQAQFDALVSFTYNVGATHFSTSTLLDRLNAGQVAAAAAEFDRWVLAKGQRLEGLVRRRAAERALFESVSPPPRPQTPARPEPLPPLPPAPPVPASSSPGRVPPRPPHLVDDKPPPPTDVQGPPPSVPAPRPPASPAPTPRDPAPPEPPPRRGW